MKPTELKKLARVCREAGIKHFKNADFEFTLTDDMPAAVIRTKQEPLSKAELDKEIESDDMSQEALLFWSTGEDYSTESQAS